MSDESGRVGRRSLIKGLGAGAVVGTAGCLGSMGGGGGGGSGVSMTIASTFEPGHILVQAAENFKEQIESESDGDISVEVSPGGSYGSEDEIGEIVSQGGVEAHAAGSFPYYQFAPKYWFFGCPFVLSDYEKLIKVLDSDQMQEAHDTLKQNGNQRPIGQQIYRGSRHFTSNSPISAPGDVKGIDLRLPELDPWVQIWEAVGASPTPVALDELYSALETGTVDASEGGAEQISSFNLQEVQSHLSLTSHLIANGNIYINESFYQGLDQTHKDLITEIGQKATQSATEKSQSREKKLISELEGKGMTIVRDVDQQAFRDAASPAVNRLFNNTWAFDWNTVQNM